MNQQAPPINPQQQQRPLQLPVRTEKENKFRIELNQVSMQLREWALQLDKVNNDTAKNISKSCMAYSANLKKVVDAN